MEALSILQDITLALQVGNSLVPVISGVIQKIESKVNADGTIDYQIALSTGQDNLNKAGENFQASLDLINSELTKMSEPPFTPPVHVQALLNPATFTKIEVAPPQQPVSVTKLDGTPINPTPGAK